MFAVQQDQRWTPIDQNRWSLRAYGREVMPESSGGALSADLNQFDEDASLQVNWRNDDPVNWLIGVYQLAANLFHTPTNSRRNQLVGKHAIKSFGIIAVTAFLGLSACRPVVAPVLSCQMAVQLAALTAGKMKTRLLGAF